MTVTKCVLSANVLVCRLGLVKLERHCEYMLGFVRVARQLYMGKQLDMVTFALKTWKNKVKMYKVIGIQCPTPAP